MSRRNRAAAASAAAASTAAASAASAAAATSAAAESASTSLKELGFSLGWHGEIKTQFMKVGPTKEGGEGFFVDFDPDSRTVTVKYAIDNRIETGVAVSRLGKETPVAVDPATRRVRSRSRRRSAAALKPEAEGGDKKRIKTTRISKTTGEPFVAKTFPKALATLYSSLTVRKAGTKLAFAEELQRGASKAAGWHRWEMSSDE